MIYVYMIRKMFVKIHKTLNGPDQVDKYLCERFNQGFKELEINLYVELMHYDMMYDNFVVHQNCYTLTRYHDGLTLSDVNMVNIQFHITIL